MKINSWIQCEQCGMHFELQNHIWYSINNITGETIAQIKCPQCGKVALTLE